MHALGGSVHVRLKESIVRNGNHTEEEIVDKTVKERKFPALYQLVSVWSCDFIEWMV